MHTESLMISDRLLIGLAFMLSYQLLHVLAIDLGEKVENFHS
jgi:hypothetical protein